MKHRLLALCLFSAVTGWGITAVGAAPVVRPQALACSVQGFSTSRAAVINQTAGTPATCWSAQVSCPAGWELVQNSTDLSGHPATAIGYDPKQRAFFYSCTSINKQTPK
jgi:hypothetical protein